MGRSVQGHVGSIVGHRDQVVLHNVVVLLCHIVLAHRVLEGEVELVVFLRVSVALSPLRKRVAPNRVIEELESNVFNYPLGT